MLRQRARSGAARDASPALAVAPLRLEALPDALLVAVLQRLPVFDRLRAQLVNRRLRALVANPDAGLWRRVSFEGACARAPPREGSRCAAR